MDHQGYDHQHLPSIKTYSTSGELATLLAQAHKDLDVTQAELYRQQKRANSLEKFISSFGLTEVVENRGGETSMVDVGLEWEARTQTTEERLEEYEFHKRSIKTQLLQLESYLERCELEARRARHSLGAFIDGGFFKQSHPPLAFASHIPLASASHPPLASASHPPLASASHPPLPSTSQPPLQQYEQQQQQHYMIPTPKFPPPPNPNPGVTKQQTPSLKSGQPPHNDSRYTKSSFGNDHEREQLGLLEAVGAVHYLFAPVVTGVPVKKQKSSGGATFAMGVDAVPTNMFPPTNSSGERICRQCGSPGRYKDGKSIEKWGPGLLGPGTACNRCQKKMKREQYGALKQQASLQLQQQRHQQQ